MVIWPGLVKAYGNTENNTVKVDCGMYKIYPDHSRLKGKSGKVDLIEYP